MGTPSDTCDSTSAPTTATTAREVCTTAATDPSLLCAFATILKLLELRLVIHMDTVNKILKLATPARNKSIIAAYACLRRHKVGLPGKAENFLFPSSFLGGTGAGVAPSDFAVWGGGGAELGGEGDLGRRGASHKL